MSTIISNVTTLFTAVIGWVGTVAQTIMAEGNELLLIFAILPLIYLGVRMFRKLMNV